MNAGARACGNHVFPVRTPIVWLLSGPVKFLGNWLRIVCIGLYPRKAANTADVGGIWLNTDAFSWGAPALAAADANEAGRLLESIRRTMLNSTPSPTVVPVFWSVLLIPEAAPLSSGGTEFIIEAVFGEENMPMDIPITKITSARVT